MLERTQSDKVKKVLSVPLGRTLMIRISRSSRIVDCFWSVEKINTLAGSTSNCSPLVVWSLWLEAGSNCGRYRTP
jgi:hypothetical protein